MSYVNPIVWDNDNRVRVNLREARKAYFSHENECECRLCMDYEQFLVEEALDRDDADCTPEFDRGGFQD